MENKEFKDFINEKGLKKEFKNYKFNLENDNNSSFDLD